MVIFRCVARSTSFNVSCAARMLMPPNESGHSQYKPPARKIGGRLTVGHDDNVLVLPGVTMEQIARETNAILEIREGIAHVPTGFGQVFNLQFDRSREESDYGKIIARIASTNEAL